MSFVVGLAPAADDDLEHLFDFLLDQAETIEDLDRAQAAIEAIRATAQHRLAVSPFEIVSPSKVVVLAVRHQLEEDDH